MEFESMKGVVVAPRYTFDDLLVHRKLYGCDILDDNSPLVMAMMKARHYYCPANGIDGVRFSYGIDCGHDPRVQLSLHESRRALNEARMRDMQITRLIEEQRRHSLPDLELSRKHLVLLISQGLLPEWYTNPVPKPDREERCLNTIEMWKRIGGAIYRQTDYFSASLALAYFNAKFDKFPPFLLEVVLGTQERTINAEIWTHCNFIARMKDGSHSRLFFAELYNGLLVTFCCILNDSASAVRGCGICSKGFIHPKDGGFLKGLSDSPTRVSR